MKVSGISMLAGVVALSATCAIAQPLEIIYTNGNLSGEFELRGTRTASNLPDTVLLADSLFITNYLATDDGPPSSCVTPQEFGLYLRATGGTVGRGLAPDTVWNDTTPHLLFPAPLESIPSENHTSNKDLVAGARGVKAGTQERGGLCGPTGFEPRSDHNRMVYFTLERASGTVYGRLMIREFEIHTDSTNPPTTDGYPVTLNGVTVSYNLSDSAVLDSTVSIRPGQRTVPGATGASVQVREGMLVEDVRHPGKLFDLRGRLHQVPAEAVPVSENP